MKPILIVLALFAALLFLAQPAEAGDHLPASHTYQMASGGTHLGQIKTDSTGNSFTYTLDGGGSTTYVWDPSTGHYKSSRGDYFDFNVDTRTWTHSNGGVSGDSGTYYD